MAGGDWRRCLADATNAGCADTFLYGYTLGWLMSLCHRTFAIVKMAEQAVSDVADYAAAHPMTLPALPPGSP